MCGKDGWEVSGQIRNVISWTCWQNCVIAFTLSRVIRWQKICRLYLWYKAHSIEHTNHNISVRSKLANIRNGECSNQRRNFHKMFPPKIGIIFAKPREKEKALVSRRRHWWVFYSLFPTSSNIANMSAVSSPEEDYRLMILIVVASFIILSLILIIGITSCLLICFEDTDHLHLSGDGQKVGVGDRAGN